MSDDLQAPCRNCGLQNQPGRDFCAQCGEYLSWAPTRQVVAVQARTVPGDPAVTDEREETAESITAGEERDRDSADGPAGTGSGEILVRRPRQDEHDADGGGDGADPSAPDAHAEDAAGAQPPDEDDSRGPLARAADETALAGPPEAIPPPEPDVEDASADGAAGATAEETSPADQPSKLRRRGPERRAWPDRAARPRWGRRATPPAPLPQAGEDADPQAKASPLDADAQAIPSAPDADVPAAPRAPADAGAPAIPSAPPDDPGAHPTVVAPPHAPDAGPPPPPPPPAPAGALAAVPDVMPASGDASIVMSHDPATVGAAGVAAVEAGRTLSYSATIRNESELVDNYELSVLGLPEGWSVVTPPTAFLVPLGSGRGESETTVRIDITPPRHFRSTAGIWTFEIIAISRTTASVAGRAIAQFEVRPFPAWSVEAVPVVNSGRLKARYRVAVRNDGNGDQDLWLLANEDSGRLRTRFKAGSLILQPGSVGVDVLTLRPRLPLPVGRTKEHRVGIDAVDTPPEVDADELSLKEKLAAQAKEKGKAQAGGLAKGVKVGPRGVSFRAPRIPNPAVLVRARVQKLTKAFKPDMAMLQRMRGGGEAAGPLTARQVVFRQKPIIPLWFIGLLLLLALIGVAIYLLLPKEVRVPDVVGAESAFVAEKELRKAGLVLSQPVQKEVRPAPVGSVVEQSPAARDKVEEGTAVTVVVAVPDGNAKVEVPDLQGLTRVEADKRLRDFDLLLGEAKPEDAGENFVVRSQIPAGDLSVAKGTAVRVFLEKPKKKAAKKKAAAKGGAAGGAAGGAGGGGSGGGGGGGSAASVTIPAFTGKNVAAYTAALSDRGLKAKVRRAIAAKPENTVLSVKPKVGAKAKKGATVTVRASAGPPTLAVQIGSKVRTFNMSSDAPRAMGTFPRGGGSAVELDYAPSGDQVVYRSGRKIVVSGVAASARPRTIYAGPDVLEHPAFAPNGRTLAVIRREEGDGDLCFGKVGTADPFDQLCLPDDGWDLDGRISWRADGKAVLVPGRRASKPSVFGLRIYETERANTTAPEMWRRSIATDVATTGKGVLAGAFAPSGGKVALVSNQKSDRFEVFVVDAGDLKLEDAESTDVAGCDVAWSADAKNLAVVQAGAACSGSSGTVRAFAADSPDDTKRVVGSGSSPVYRPVG